MKPKAKILSSICVAILVLLAVIPFATANAADKNRENYTSLELSVTFEETFTPHSKADSGISLFSNTVYSGCFGNQLDGSSKEIYDSLVQNYATDKKIGEYEFKLKSPIKFQIEGNDATQSAIKAIESAGYPGIYAFLYDHPEVFWIRIFSFKFGYSQSQNIGTISKITIVPIEAYDGASSKIQQYDNAVNAVVQEIENKIPYNETSDIKTIKASLIHDYICEKAYYSYSSEYKIHTSAPFFLGDKGMVCEGYAETFKVLCDKLDVPCVLVGGESYSSSGTGAHMWNYVQMYDGKWYLVDTTWDDQESQIYHTYFLANRNSQGFNTTIKNERKELTDFSDKGYFNFTYPPLSTTEFVSHKHSWSSIYTVDVQATCTSAGSKSYHCLLPNCKEKNNVVVIPAKGHTEVIDSAVAATCTTDGKTQGKHCSVCNAVIIAQTTVPAKGHTEVIDSAVAATCTAAGKTEGKHCSVCNAVIIAQTTIPAKGHTEVVDSAVAATCTTDGKTQGKHCSVCGTVTVAQTTIPAHHTEVVDSAVAATCTTDGKTEGKHCSVCGTVTVAQTTIPAKGHTEVIDSAVAATCTAAGKTEGKHCSVCNTVIIEQTTVPATGHDYGDWIVTTPASCTKDGIKQCTCSLCGNAKALLINKIPHDYESSVTTEATCTQDGTTTYKCKNCGRMYATLIDKIPHDYESSVTREATCTQDGIRTYKCKNCDYSYTTSIDKIPHDYASSVTREATCTQNGIRTYKCKNCDDIYALPIDKIPHDYASSVTRKATCSKEGVTTYKCKNCDNSYTKPIAKLAHSYKTTTTKATTSKNGSTVTKCTVCGNVKSTVTIAKIKSVKLSKTSLTYNGKTQKPTVTVKDNKGKTLKNGTDYTVKYSKGCKNVGQYTVTVTFKGNYSGTKTLTFKIVPKGTSVSKLSAGKKQFKVEWKKQTSQTTGYEIQYSTSSKMKNAKTVTVGKNKTTSTTVKNLKSGKKYYVRIRTYKTVKINGKSVKLYSSWSSVKNVKTK